MSSRSRDVMESGAAITRALRVRLAHVLGLGGIGPWDLAKRVTASALRNDCLGQAAKIAYSMLFALFPFLLFLTTLPAFLPVPDVLEELLAGAEQLVPAEALDLVQRNIRDLLTRGRSGLLTVTLLVALGAGTSAMMALMDSLNRAYGIRERRPFWLFYGTALVLTVGLTVFGIGAAAFGTGVIAWLKDEAHIGPGLIHLVTDPLRWPIVIVLLMIGTATIYYFGPDLRQGWKWMTPGAIFAVVGWIAASLLFRRYVGAFGQYNQLHGSLGAVIVLLTWMYMSGLFVILGGEINAKIEHASPLGRQPGRRRLKFPLFPGKDDAEEELGEKAAEEASPSRPETADGASAEPAPEPRSSA